MTSTQQYPRRTATIWRRIRRLWPTAPGHRPAAHRLYVALVNQARAPWFFADLGVPDTPEGRFEMIGLHAALVLRRLRTEGPAGQALGQALFDLMFADMDAGLRELGIGDLSVGKHVKRLARQFYARLRAIDGTLAAARMSQLEPMLRRNIYQGGGAPSDEQITALAAYLFAVARDLDGQAGAALLQGEVGFPPAAPAGRGPQSD